MRPDGPRDTFAGPETGPEDPFPIRIAGPIVKGFGRGSKELGIPTANIPLNGLTVGGHDDLESGVYYGWAGLHINHNGEAETGTPSADKHVFPMVMSLGWNPFYGNKEVHIIHKFARDFYGQHLNIAILGFIRPEYDYISKDSLIEDINTDIAVTIRSLERPDYIEWKDDKFLTAFPR